MTKFSISSVLVVALTVSAAVSSVSLAKAGVRRHQKLSIISYPAAVSYPTPKALHVDGLDITDVKCKWLRHQFLKGVVSGSNCSGEAKCEGNLPTRSGKLLHTTIRFPKVECRVEKENKRACDNATDCVVTPGPNNAVQFEQTPSVGFPIYKDSQSAEE